MMRKVSGSFSRLDGSVTAKYCWESWGTDYEIRRGGFANA